MIFELEKNGLIKIVKDGKSYMIDNVQVMNYRVDVYENTKEIICKTYDQYKNDGRNSLEDIIPLKHEILFKYEY